MTKKIVLTILVIAALLVAIYKWIMSSVTMKKQCRKQQLRKLKNLLVKKKQSSQKRMPRRLKKMAKTQ